MKVLIVPNFMNLEQGLADLQRDYPEIEFVHCADRDLVASAIADADIFMGWLSKEVFLAAKNLKWVQSPSSGINYYLAIPEFVASDVLLSGASGTHGACVAESAMAMILGVTRGMREGVLAQKEKKWAGQIRKDLVELSKSTMGIVGFGQIGRSLGKRAHAFDMRVLAVDMYPNDPPDWADGLWPLDRLDDLLRESDYVAVTVPHTDETHGMIGAEQIALMKPSAMLVGISRGGIIDQDALTVALKNGKLAQAVLDVFSPEPLPEDSELWEMDNVLIMPHVAGATQFEAQYILEIFRENLDRFLKGDFAFRNLADKQRGF